MMWNDVNKILPEKDGDYLVYIRNAEAPCVLSFHADVGVWYDEVEGDFYNVTHWLPIPPNPYKLESINQEDIDFLKDQFSELYSEINKIRGIASVIFNPRFTNAISECCENIEDTLSEMECVIGDIK